MKYATYMILPGLEKKKSVGLKIDWNFTNWFIKDEILYKKWI